MTAEEYIQSESTTFESPNIDSTTEIIETFIAKKAIKMARQEERDKIIKIIEDNTIPYYANKLKKLLNK